MCFDEYCSRKTVKSKCGRIMYFLCSVQEGFIAKGSITIKSSVGETDMIVYVLGVKCSIVFSNISLEVETAWIMLTLSSGETIFFCRPIYVFFKLVIPSVWSIITPLREKILRCFLFRMHN